MYEDDFDDDAGTDLVKNLRKQLKALQKERDDARAEAENLKSTVKQRSVQEVLASKGANPKLAKFALADGVEDEAGAEAWLAENGELFGFKAQTEPAVDDDEMAAMQAVQNATSTGGVTNTQIAAQERILNEADTPEAWVAAVNALKHGQPIQ